MHKAFVDALSRHPWAVILILVGVFAVLYFMGRRGGREGLENAGNGKSAGAEGEVPTVVDDSQLPADTSHIAVDKIGMEETMRPKRSNSVPVRKQMFESNEVIPATEGMLGKGSIEGFCSSCASAY